MKKLICSLICIAMLLPLCIPSFAGDEPSFTVSQSISLETLGPNAAHGNHQTRTVHTSHGDYSAYITGSYRDTTITSNDNVVNTWSLIKTDPTTGESTVVFEGEKYDDSSQVSLLVDRDENVWAVTSTSDFLRHYRIEGLDLRAHKLDARTGEVTSYTTINTNGGARDWYGYGMSFYDAKNNRIICMHAGGDYQAGNAEGASFNWTYFDIDKGEWASTIYYVKIPARHCYFYGYVDKNGGLVLLAQRDIKVTSLGYPEVGNNTGLSDSDYNYMGQHGISRHAADYAWDQLDMYYFPDITKSEIYTYTVSAANYSRVVGSQSDRYTLSKRLTNFYPVNQNNNGGDFLWTETKNGMTLLHITYNSSYIQAAMNRSVANESKWYHQVWNMTCPTEAQMIYSAPITVETGIVDEINGESGYSFRLYQDSNGNVYLVSGHNGSLSLYKVTKPADSYNYTYEKVGDSVSLPGLGNMISISSHRGGSLTDDTINVLYVGNNNKYNFVSVSLNSTKNTDEFICMDHSYYLSNELSTPSSCTSHGINVYRCSLCYSTYSEEAPFAHDLSEVSVTPSTCNSYGHYEGNCAICGTKVEGKLEPAPHKFTEYIFHPTCKASGYSEKFCSRCGYSTEEDLERLPHFLINDVTDSTCTTEGKIVSRCKNCSYTESKTLPKKEHSYEYGICTACGEEDPDYVPAPAYILGDINADGAINGKDSNQQRQIISGSAMPTENERLAADVNADSAINGIDANILSKFLAGALGSLE